MLQIHQKIEQARISAGLTQDEMAEKLGIKRSTYQYWEKKTPGIDKVRQVADVLKLPVDYFFVTNDENTERQVAMTEEPEGAYKAQSVRNLTESNRILAEANRTLAEANKTLAEANHVISKNHDELIQLTKMIVANSTASPRTQPGGFGPENNVVSPGFGSVKPSDSEVKPGKPKDKH